MKELSVIYFLSLTILWLILPTTIGAQPDMDPCVLFPDGTKLRHPDDCGQEIICNNFKAVNGIKCPDSNPFYDKDTNRCVKHISDHSTCEIDCNNKNGTFVKDPKYCEGYYYCLDDVAHYGHCPRNTHFNETQQACIHAYNSSCVAYTLDLCSIVKVGVKFKHQTNCGKYFECVKSKGSVELKEYFCEKPGPYYDALKGKCVDKPIEGCHPVPKNACSKITKNHNFISDGYTCRGYFYCKDKNDQNPTWGQCQGYKFYSDGKCDEPLNVQCSYNRCEGSDRVYVTSNRSGCRHYLYCENNVKTFEGDCGNDFFDELQGVCTTKIVDYKACYHS
ncbi:peritrophin-44 [Cochliomyia hominivorax]